MALTPRYTCTLCTKNMSPPTSSLGQGCMGTLPSCFTAGGRAGQALLNRSCCSCREVFLILNASRYWPKAWVGLRPSREWSCLPSCELLSHLCQTSDIHTMWTRPEKINKTLTQEDGRGYFCLPAWEGREPGARILIDASQLLI